MTANTLPHVSVVIPVFNGENTLSDAIRSVQEQTYTEWDLTVANNRSTDRSAAIAQEFAASDSRIRVVTYTEHVNVLQSYNNALALRSDAAKYTKVLAADDWLFPRCLSKLVDVAERHPSVALVCSYVLAGTEVKYDGLPYPSPCTSGREVGRKRLLNTARVIGPPSACLLRTCVVDGRQPFYNPLNFGADAEAHLELLKDYDFGFVHQILTYLRTGPESRTSEFVESVGGYFAGDVYEVRKFGRYFLTEDEYRRRLKEVTGAYYRFLAFRALHAPGREFWDYHFKHVKALGYNVSRWRLGWYVVERLLDMLLNPKRTLGGLGQRAAERLGRGNAAAPNRAHSVARTGRARVSH
jgi:glycosyltransferase involved in cell wall biosynthesis